MKNNKRSYKPKKLSNHKSLVFPPHQQMLLFKVFKVKRSHKLLLKRNPSQWKNKSLKNLKWTLKQSWICRKSVRIMEILLRSMIGVNLFKKSQFRFLFLRAPPLSKWTSKYSQKDFMLKSKAKTKLWLMANFKKKSKLKILSGALKTKNSFKSLSKKLMKLFGRQLSLVIKKLIPKLLTIPRKLKNSIWKLKAIFRKFFMNRRGKEMDFLQRKKNNNKS